ncbi:MAG TPA: glycosyl hydrolase family 18 protein [Virgibacillus sp.]|nr:glycosyl hydrolase family 18 protein [Virgibacillus sp.]HLR68409.1 glycosyl hydrolase family 18 protein [Virgibacillus sp.]
MKKSIAIWSIMFACFFVLAACNEDQNEEQSNQENNHTNAEEAMETAIIENVQESIDQYREKDEIEDDETVEGLTEIVDTIEEADENDENEKVLASLKELRETLNAQKDKDHLSDAAYESLHTDVRDLTGKHDEPAVVGYWEGEDELKLEDVPAENLTHINYAFANVEDDGTASIDSDSEKEVEKLNQYKEDHDHIETLISIGGWGDNSKKFSDAAATPESREKFVQTTIDTFIDEYQFNGIDIDWEFPVRGGEDGMMNRVNDDENLTKLFEEFRKQLNQKEIEDNEEYLLTTATPAGRYQNGGTYEPADSYEFDKIPEYLDWVQVMTYDLANGFAPTTNHNAAMEAVDSDPTPEDSKKWNNVSGAVEYYMNEGVPEDKIVLGTAFYGRSFEVSENDNDGLFQEFEEPGDNADWRDIKNEYLKDSDWEEHWDSDAEVPWLFNEETNMFLTYDNPKSIEQKAKFIKDNDLRGGMIWSIGLDDKDHSLLDALAKPILEEDN